MFTAYTMWSPIPPLQFVMEESQMPSKRNININFWSQGDHLGSSTIYLLADKRENYISFYPPLPWICNRSRLLRWKIWAQCLIKGTRTKVTVKNTGLCSGYGGGKNSERKCAMNTAKESCKASCLSCPSVSLLIWT